MQTFTIDSGAVRVRFDKAHGVFPAQVALRNYDGEYENVLREGSGLSVVMPDGKKLHPCAGGFTKVEKHGEVDRVIFQEVSFQDDSGNVENGFRGYMTYEFYPDGTMFSNIFFYVTTDSDPFIFVFVVRLLGSMNHQITVFMLYVTQCCKFHFFAS